MIKKNTVRSTGTEAFLEKGNLPNGWPAPGIYHLTLTLNQKYHRLYQFTNDLIYIYVTLLFHNQQLSNMVAAYDNDNHVHIGFAVCLLNQFINCIF